MPYVVFSLDSWSIRIVLHAHLAYENLYKATKISNCLKVILEILHFKVRCLTCVYMIILLFGLGKFDPPLMSTRYAKIIFLKLELLKNILLWEGILIRFLMVCALWVSIGWFILTLCNSRYWLSISLWLGKKRFVLMIVLWSIGFWFRLGEWASLCLGNNS